MYDVLSGDSLTKASLKMKLVKTLDTHIIIKTFRLLNVSINIGLKNIVWLNILESYKSFNIFAFVGVAPKTETINTNKPYGLVLNILE